LSANRGGGDGRPHARRPPDEPARAPKGGATKRICALRGASQAEDQGRCGPTFGERASPQRAAFWSRPTQGDVVPDPKLVTRATASSLRGSRLHARGGPRSGASVSSRSAASPAASWGSESTSWQRWTTSGPRCSFPRWVRRLAWGPPSRSPQAATPVSTRRFGIPRRGTAPAGAWGTWGGCSTSATRDVAVGQGGRQPR
jgi:hypothetical protein